jgi:heptose I phosphotransferase
VLNSSDHFRAAPDYQPLLRQIGLDAQAVFRHPDIVAWRTIPERQNCTLDTESADGRPVRLHIKRYARVRSRVTPADREARGIAALESHDIPTAPLVGWGRLRDGRSFIITEDLAGHRAADKLVAGGLDFERLLDATAALAGRLHRAALHHRDLYLCHFLAEVDAARPRVKLIDAARVRRLPGWPTRTRWIVKDLAQFWYSTLALPVSDDQRTRWLKCYAKSRGIKSAEPLRPAIIRKAAWIAKHDARLRQRQPGRNISIPAEGDFRHR